MRIADILDRKGTEVVTIGATATVHDAILRLNEHRIGALVVAGEDEEIVGIITERDILRECGERCARLIEPGASEPECPALVSDVMTRKVIVGVPQDELSYVMGIMTKNRIRHLPVVDGERLVGIVSIGDAVSAHVDEAEVENRQLKAYIRGGTY